MVSAKNVLILLELTAAPLAKEAAFQKIYID